MIVETYYCLKTVQRGKPTYLIDHFKICRHIIVVTQIGLNPYYVVLHNYVRI